MKQLYVLQQLDAQWARDIVSDRATNLIWVDCETTGLDHECGHLLEVAVVVTDKDLLELAFESHAVRVVQDAMGSTGDYLREVMVPEVFGWHERSGLLALCASDRTPLPREVEDSLRRFASAYVDPGVSPMCGSTVSFNRAWLKRHMPRLEGHFHYRNVDVSTVKELARRWGLPTPPKLEDKPHRALPDVRASVAELRLYRERFLRDPEALVRTAWQRGYEYGCCDNQGDDVPPLEEARDRDLKRILKA